MEKRNIILIGMPGAGKSTIGVVLAKKCGYRFIDSDLVIQDIYGKLLHELITEYGVDGFLEIENKINAKLEAEQAIIATGGSAVYGVEAMRHLQSIGEVVYLKLSYQSVETRLGDLNERGVTLRKGQTLRDLYDEREPLYENYATMIIDCENKSIREIIDEIYQKVCKA